MATTNNHKYVFDLDVKTPTITLKMGDHEIQYDLLAAFYWILDRQDAAHKAVEDAPDEQAKSEAWMRYLESFRSFICSETGISYTRVSVLQASQLYSYIIKAGDEYFQQQQEAEEEAKKNAGVSDWTVYSQPTTQASPEITETGPTTTNGTGSTTSGSAQPGQPSTSPS